METNYLQAPKPNDMTPDAVPKSFKAGTPCHVSKAREFHRTHVSDGWTRGVRRCHGCCLVDAVPTHICFVPMGCCLWGFWSLCYVPCPLAPLVTCLCKDGDSYITEKAGMKTGELLLVDDESGTLAFYGEGCGGETSPCWCTK